MTHRKRRLNSFSILLLHILHLVFIFAPEMRHTLRVACYIRRTDENYNRHPRGREIGVAAESTCPSVVFYSRMVHLSYRKETKRWQKASS